MCAVLCIMTIKVRWATANSPTFVFYFPANIWRILFIYSVFGVCVTGHWRWRWRWCGNNGTVRPCDGGPEQDKQLIEITWCHQWRQEVTLQSWFLLFTGQLALVVAPGPLECMLAGLGMSELLVWWYGAPHNVNDKVSSGVTQARTDHFTQNFGFLTGQFIDFTTTKTQ